MRATPAGSDPGAHWRTVSVWVRSGVSTRLGHLLAEQDENAHRKPLNQLEAAALYRELSDS